MIRYIPIELAKMLGAKFWSQIRSRPDIKEQLSSLVIHLHSEYPNSIKWIRDIGDTFLESRKKEILDKLGKDIRITTDCYKGIPSINVSCFIDKALLIYRWIGTNPDSKTLYILRSDETIVTKDISKLDWCYALETINRTLKKSLSLEELLRIESLYISTKNNPEC